MVSWVIPGQTPNITANIDGVPANVLNNNIADAATTALWPNVTGYGRPQDFATVNNGLFANLNGQITPGNSLSYIQQGAVVGIAYARSNGTTNTSIDVSVSFNSYNSTVIVTGFAKLRSHAFTTVGGGISATVTLFQNGVYVVDAISGSVPNVGGNSIIISLSDSIVLTNTGSASIVYTLRYAVNITGDGVNAGLLYPSIQVMGIK